MPPIDVPAAKAKILAQRAALKIAESRAHREAANNDRLAENGISPVGPVTELDQIAAEVQLIKAGVLRGAAAVVLARDNQGVPTKLAVYHGHAAIRAAKGPHTITIPPVSRQQKPTTTTRSRQ